MSTRRSARATSKAASEVSNAATATPKRTTRSTGPLPAVGTRTSNAYGTNTVAASSRATGPEVANQISGLLDDLLHAGTTSTPARRRRGTSQASSNRGGRGISEESGLDISRSFNNESGIFGEAHIESSIHTPDLSMIDEEEEVDEGIDSPLEQTFAAQSQQAQRQALEEVARRDRIHYVDATSSFARFAATKTKIQDAFRNAEFGRSSVFKFAAAAFSLFVLFFLLLAAIPGTGFHNYGLSAAGMKHNVGQFIPFHGSFSSSDVSNIKSRIWAAEQDILKLQQRPILDQATIKKLHSILPDTLVVKKDRLGNLVLPNGLWRAIHDKIQSDPSLVLSGGGSESDGAVISSKQVDAVIAQSAEKFFKSNNLKAKVIDGRFSHLLHNARNDEIVISRAEAIDLVRDNWEDNQTGIKSEMSNMRKELDKIIRTVSRLEDSPLLKSEIESIAKDVFTKMLPNAQLGALSKANLKSNVNFGLTKVNHFSIGTGAVINAKLKSPDFVFPAMDINPFKRVLHSWFLDPVPLPNPASEALTKWHEHGDCWCSPSKDQSGFGPSLAVIMGSNIYPEEVVIEHIHATAALEPGAAPKDMELLAYIPEIDHYEAARAVSNELFPSDLGSDGSDLPFRYVRVGTWTYDSKAAENIQAFDVQLDMKRFNLHTNKLIVRAKNNWGGVEYTCLYRVRVHGEIVHTPGIY